MKSWLKYLCAATALFLAFGAQAQQAPDIAGTFDTKALTEHFALSCAAQADMRARNILPPHFGGRPPEFQNKERALVIYSPHLSGKQRTTSEELFASVPPHVLAIAYRGGATYVFARRSVVEAVPGLAVEDSWFGDTGLYMAVERRLYIPFERGERVYKNTDGMYKARRFTPSLRDPFRITNHESGHLIDDLLGNYSKDSKGADGDDRMSNRADFQKALNVDLRRLTSGARTISDAEIRRMGYYMPREFQGVPLGGIQSSVERVRREIYAELWAEVQGYDSNRLSTAYPDTFAVLKSHNDYLKGLYNAAPVQCGYANPSI